MKYFDWKIIITSAIVAFIVVIAVVSVGGVYDTGTDGKVVKGSKPSGKFKIFGSGKATQTTP